VVVVEWGFWSIGSSGRVAVVVEWLWRWQLSGCDGGVAVGVVVVRVVTVAVVVEKVVAVAMAVEWRSSGGRVAVAVVWR
jgi:hypothetical protein